jgi:predicted amino acid dehydrogenase
MKALRETTTPTAPEHPEEIRSEKDRRTETPLRAADAEPHRFAFVIHPLSADAILRHPAFRWTRFLPTPLVEAAAAHIPPIYLARIRGGRSEATGQRIEGFLFSIGATPRQILGHDPSFTYRRLNHVARMAQDKGARILGLGAYTKVVGDAGLTVAREARIPVTTGNSLTVAATLETAKEAMRRMGAEDLARGRVMIVGATGAIGSACSRLVARAVRDVVLVSIEPDRLVELKRKILEEVPDARVAVATRADELLGECDLVITATSGAGQRVIDLSRCKPGAVICDVALPCDVPEEEAALRPDVLVVESGEVRIPGPVDFGYDIGLPKGVAYACLAEAALLAMEGRFEPYTLGRDIDVERVKEAYRLFRKHGFRLSELRSFGKVLSEEDYAARRDLARRLRDDPELFERVKADAAARLATMPPKSKGVPATPRRSSAGLTAAWTVGLGAVAGLGVGVGILAGMRMWAQGASSPANPRAKPPVGVRG